MDEAPHAQPSQAAPPGPQQRVGTVINGKWRLDAMIGVGGMAVVYSATHRNGRRAALKILHPEFARDQTIRERFLREGYLGNKIPHEGRVEVFDNDVTEDGADFLVMELLHGETLDQIIKRNAGRLPLADALEIVEQLLDFLAQCHAQGIVHRDLKPANIFLTEEGRVKVLDFGVAQHREQQNQALTRAGTAIGTPSYMSPEQARGLGDKLDGRSDIFSVGSILFYVLSGQRLHKGRSNDESLILAATQPAPSLARVAPEQPVEIIALVDKALAWDRRNRFQDAQEMRAEVLRLLGRTEEPASSQPEDVPVAFEHAPQAQPQQRTVAAEDDPDVLRLRSTLKALERLLPAVRQYGWSHPETERRLRALFESFLEALSARASLPADERPIPLAVHPYAFTYRHTTVWEPVAPLDAVPYALFESGIRGLQFRAGVTEPELRALVEVMLTDPSRDLAPEDDLATMLWDANLEHVETVLESGFAEGTFAQREAFHQQSDALERLAVEAARVADLEAKAMAVTTDKDALAASTKSWGIVDSTTRAALRTQLGVPPERWTERYVDALVDAYLEARRTRSVPLVLDPVRDSCADLVVAHRTPVVLDLHGAAIEVLAMRSRALAGARSATGTASQDPAALTDEVASEFTRSILGGNVFELVVHALRTSPKTSPDFGPLSEVLLTAVTRLGAFELGHALDALVHFAGEGGEIEADDARIVDSLEHYLVRVGRGHEREIAARLSHDRLGAARRILSVLVQLGTNLSKELVEQVLAGADVVLRIEALAAKAASSGGAIANELARLLDHDRDDVRVAALRAIARHHLREIGPILVRRIQDGTFHDRVDVERREMLSTLHALHPSRAEAVAIELLEQRGMIRSETREQSRVIAARLLGANSRSSAALEAIKQARGAWFGSSDLLRGTLDEAARAIEARMAEPASTPMSVRGGAP